MKIIYLSQKNNKLLEVNKTYTDIGNGQKFELPFYSVFLRLSNERTFLRYESVIALDKEEGCDTEDMSLDSPPYIVIAKTAQLWLAGNLKQGRDPNKAGDLYNEAAEVAMNCMKGKMANKYYMLAEEAYGEAEDE